jgi:hypothetical protein
MGAEGGLAVYRVRKLIALLFGARQKRVNRKGHQVQSPSNEE